MKTFFALLVVLGAPVSALARSDADAGIPKVMQRGDDPNIGIKYKKNQGLFVTNISARIIGLEMVDVAEQPIERSLTFQAQVYEAAPVGKALASGWVPESQAAALAPGLIVNIEGAGRASIIGLSTLTAASNQMIEVLLEVEDPADSMVVGQFIIAAARQKSQGVVVVIPKQALLRTAEGTFVYADNSGWKVRTAVKPGSEFNGLIEITEGLYAGDSVVANPVMTLWMTELQLTKSGKA